MKKQDLERLELALGAIERCDIERVYMAICSSSYGRRPGKGVRLHLEGLRLDFKKLVP